MPYIASVRPAPIFGLRVDYSSVMTQALFNPFGGRLVIEIPRGVHVRELIANTPAAAKFKALGENDRWVITQVNGAPVLTPAAFYKEARGVKSLKLTVTDPTEPGVVRTVVLP
jgi:hypothetical protein